MNWHHFLFCICLIIFLVIHTLSWLQVLVHGEMTEMSRLKSALEREYESSTDNPVKVYNPKNLETVTFHFRGEKMAKVSSPHTKTTLC